MTPIDCTSAERTFSRMRTNSAGNIFFAEFPAAAGREVKVRRKNSQERERPGLAGKEGTSKSEDEKRNQKPAIRSRESEIWKHWQSEIGKIQETKADPGKSGFGGRERNL